MRQQNTSSSNRTSNRGGNTIVPRENPYAEGSRYYDMYAANPYAPENRTRRETIWDKLANVFGFRSGYEIYNDQANVDMLNEDARIAELKGQDEYNEPAAQNARERAAGINTDLVGIQGSDAATREPAAPTADLTGADQAEKVGNLMNGIAQTVLMASGLTTDIAKTLGILEDNTGKRINNALGMDKLADTFLLSNVSSFGDEIKSEDNWQGHLFRGLFGEDGKSGFAGQWADNYGLSGRQKKMFISNAIAKLSNGKGMLYDKWEEGLKSRTKFYQTAGSKWTSQSDNFEENMMAFKPLMDAVDKYFISDAEGKAEEASNKTAYEKTSDPVLKGEAENKENEWKKENTQLMKDMKKAFGDVMKNLTERAEGGDKFAWFMTLLLPTLYQKFMQ